MTSAFSTGAVLFTYGYNVFGYASEALSDEIEKDELPNGRIHNSMTEQINSELSAALKRKAITVTALRPKGESDAVIAQGKVGSLATVTLSPELFSGENTKATEWRIARAIGRIQSDNLMPALKKSGVLALTAGVAHYLLGAFCWTWAIALGVTALNSYAISPLLFDRTSDAESLKFANSVATKEQLEGGIRFLEEQAKAAQECHVKRQEWLAGYHPSLKEGYTRAYDIYRNYVPGAETELEETKKTYRQKFSEKSKPALKPSAQLPKVAPKEVIVNNTASVA